MGERLQPCPPRAAALCILGRSPTRLNSVRRPVYPTPQPHAHPKSPPLCTLGRRPVYPRCASCGETRLKLSFSMAKLDPGLRMRDYSDACLCEKEVAALHALDLLE